MILQQQQILILKLFLEKEYLMQDLEKLPYQTLGVGLLKVQILCVQFMHLFNMHLQM